MRRDGTDSSSKNEPFYIDKLDNLWQFISVTFIQGTVLPLNSEWKLLQCVNFKVSKGKE